MSELGLSDLVVVVVEPSTMQRHIVEKALGANGISTILACEDGAQALTLVEQESPDLVISTMYLPDMTGTDLIHLIRESEQAKDTPFLLISSETRFRYLDPIRQAGAVGILPKPFTDAELRTALTATLDFLSEDAGLGAGIDGESLRVLVVDDSAMARRQISRILAAMGIEHIDHAEDGLQGLEMVKEYLYDFVITDYNMPRMDGRELIEQIRTETAQSSLPVLMVTSENNENRLAAVQQSGVSAICDKPFEPAMVQRIVRQMVNT
jgi:two-component system chemotaxis response regulator CheY